MTTPGNTDDQIKKIHARYRFRKKIATRGNSDSFHAVERETGADVVIKLFQEQAVFYDNDMTQQKARFHREISSCIELAHPNIARVLDFGETVNGVLYVVFEHVIGNTLTELVKREGTISLKQTKVYMEQTLRGLHAAHSTGIAHRDITPETLMVAKNGDTDCVKILDFGMASFTLRPPKNSAGPPSERAHRVSSLYAAPEQLRNETVTMSCDLYAWGLVFLTCLTGKPPFVGNESEIVQQQLSPSRVPIPRRLVEHPLGDLLKGVLEKEHPRRETDSVSLLTQLKNLDADE